MTTKKVTRKTCDQCGKESECVTNLCSAGGVPFVGWISVLFRPVSTMVHETPEFDFCGKPCLLTWLEKRMGKGD